MSIVALLYVSLFLFSSGLNSPNYNSLHCKWLYCFCYIYYYKTILRNNLAKLQNSLSTPRTRSIKKNIVAHSIDHGRERTWKGSKDMWLCKSFTNQVRIGEEHETRSTVHYFMNRGLLNVCHVAQDWEDQHTSQQTCESVHNTGNDCISKSRVMIERFKLIFILLT